PHRTDLGGQPPGAVPAQQAPPPAAERERPGPDHHHASHAHQGAHIPFDDLNAERSYRGFGRYCETKLANILFTTELARRLEGTGVTVNCFHPGLVATGFKRNNGLLMNLGMTILRPVARSPEKGADAPHAPSHKRQVRLASHTSMLKLAQPSISRVARE